MQHTRRYGNLRGAQYAVALLLILGVGSAVRADSTITVSTSDFRQTINGFGASDAFVASTIYGFPAAQRSQALDLLFSQQTGIGLSLLRHRVPVEIEPSPGVWDWTKDDAAIWLTKEALKRGLTAVWSTPWSPPAWMKTNNNVNNGGALAPAHYQDYANYLSMYIRKYNVLLGVKLQAISLQNEPDQTTTYESCTWTGAQFHDFIADYLIPTFQKDGVTTQVLMPERSSWDESLATETLSDPVAAAAVSMIGTHNYGGTISPFPNTETQGKPIWETEVSNLNANDSSIADGIGWAISLHTALTVGGVSAWHYWWLIDPWDSTGQGLITASSSNGKFALLVNKRLWTLGHFSRFVRPGYRRVALSSDNPESGVYTSAFRDPVSGNLVVVAINSNSMLKRVTVNLPGYHITSITPYRTSATESLGALPAKPVTSGRFLAGLPAMSVTTFVGKGTAVAQKLPLRVHCGGPATGGFAQDSGYWHGNVYSVSTAISTTGVPNAAPAAVYQTQRYGAATYTLADLTPLTTYTVRLHFAETWFSAAGKRRFDVLFNGHPLIKNLDVFAAAGGANRALVKTFKVASSTRGTITLSLVNGTLDNAMLSGIEVLSP